MRAVMVGPAAPHGGGIVHYTEALLNALDAEGADAELLTYSQLFPRFLYKGATEVGRSGLHAGIPVNRLLHYGKPATWRRAARWVKGAQVVHFQVWTPFLSPSMTPIAKAAQRGGAKVIATLHNAQPHEARDRILNFFTRRLLKHVDHVLVHSERLREPAGRAYGLDPAKIRVLPMATFSRFDGGAWTRETARTRLGFGPNDVVGLMFGAIRDYKGVPIAIEALARLPPKFRLLIAGKAWEDWKTHEAHITRLGLQKRIVAVTDYVPDEDVELYHKAADVALFPYVHFEAQSAAAMTAVSFKLPIVASDVGGFNELVSADCLVRPGDPASLAAAWSRAAGTMTRRVGDETSWEMVAKRMVSLYEE